MWQSTFSSPRTSVPSLLSLTFLNQLQMRTPGLALVSYQHSRHYESTSQPFLEPLSASLTLMGKTMSLFKKGTAELAHYEAVITSDPLPPFLSCYF